MKTGIAAAETKLSPVAVRRLLRDIGYALWLARKLSAEITAEKSEPVRPEMSEFCAIEAGAFAA
jgi:hypothetical protein